MKKHEKTWKSAIYNIAYILYIHQIITYVPISLSITSWTKVIESCGNYIDWAVRSICYHINYVVLFLAFSGCSVFGGFGHSLGIYWVCMWFASHPTGPRLQHQFQTEVTWRSRMADCLRMFSHFSPHLCVGFLFLVVHFRLSAPAPAAFLHTHTHTQLVPHNLLTHTTCPHTTCPHTTCPHTTYSHTALGDMDVHSAWQAWHLSCWAGFCGALGPCWAPWSPPPFAWQAWHFATSTFTLRGRRGTSRHRPSLCVAGVAFGDIDLHFAWQALHFATSTFTLRGKRGTSRHRPSLCVAGVALGDMDVHSAWQAWHLSCWAGSGGTLGPCWAPWSPPPFAWQAWHFATSTFTLRGRRGTSRHRPSLCVAGVALGDMDVHSAWQMWHLSYLAGSGGALGPRWAPWSPPPFAWQAWHFATSNFTLRGRRGTYGTYNLSTFCFGSSCTYTLRTYTHAHTHTHTHAVSCTILSHTHIHTTFTHHCIHSFHAPPFDIHLLHTPILHHLLSLSCISHPIFTFLLLLIGRSWHVGLSGPLIYCSRCFNFF